MERLIYEAIQRISFIYDKIICNTKRFIVQLLLGAYHTDKNIFVRKVTAEADCRPQA